MSKSKKQTQNLTPNDDLMRELMHHFKEMNLRFEVLSKQIGDQSKQIRELTERALAAEAKVEEMEQSLEKKFMAELSERERRRRELIIFDTPESNLQTGVERQKSDLQQAVKKLNKLSLGLADKDIEYTRRIGPFTQNADLRSGEKRKPRPLLVGFYDEINKKKTILSARNSTDKSIKPSLTKNQRNHIASLYEDRDMKNNEEQDSNFRWIVSGPPGEERLRRVRKEK